MPQTKQNPLKNRFYILIPLVGMVYSVLWRNILLLENNFRPSDIIGDIGNGVGESSMNHNNESIPSNHAQLDNRKVESSNDNEINDVNTPSEEHENKVEVAQNDGVDPAAISNDGNTDIGNGVEGSSTNNNNSIPSNHVQLDNEKAESFNDNEINDVNTPSEEHEIVV